MLAVKSVLALIAGALMSLQSAGCVDLCAVEDPVRSCECYFDGQHFAVLCTRTDLTELPRPADIPRHVELLDVSHNRIATLDFIGDGFHSKLLRVLRVSHNAIATLPSAFLASMPHLVHLDLSHNHLTQLEAGAFDAVASLHHLDLSFNRIQLLPDAAFATARKLRFLDLSYNDLGEQLQSFSSLSSSGLGFTDTMQTLRLDAVNMSSVPKAYFQNLSLEVLSLADNGIEEIPVLPLSLVSVDLSGNDFSAVTPSRLVYSRLKELRLNRLRRLEAIHNYAFYHLPSLEALEIEHCPKLKSFNDKAFGVIVEKEEWNLRRISLNGNTLRRLNETYFHLFNKIDIADLSGNPWICDCGVLWLKLVKPKLINQRNMRCVAPKRLRNNQVLQLDENLLPACNVQSNIRVQKILTSIICILVVVLLGVIMYLIYLAPYKGNQTNRYIGGDSPYNNIVVRDANSYIDL